MAHDVNAGLGPVMEFSLMPELFCLGKVGVVKHTHSFINPELFIKTADTITKYPCYQHINMLSQ
jgi:hypothetical protein